MNIRIGKNLKYKKLAGVGALLVSGLLITWMIWATFSTGGLSKLELLNPLTTESESAKYLASMLNRNTESDIDNIHYCYAFMPNWPKASLCVKNRSFCEKQIFTPARQSQKYIKFTNSLPTLNIDDVSREEAVGILNEIENSISTCMQVNGPSLEIVEWLRTSRYKFRIKIYQLRFFLSAGKLSENPSYWKKLTYPDEINKLEWRKWVLRGR